MIIDNDKNQSHSYENERKKIHLSTLIKNSTKMLRWIANNMTNTNRQKKP